MFLSPLRNAVPALTPAEEDLLRVQAITMDTPGPILRDVETLLDFIGEDGVRVSAKQHVFGGSTLTDLNVRLSRPMAATFKRPQQKSFPYVHGLYLLLRASGLAYVEQQGRQQVLLLDPTVVASWDALNPAEQYFSLYRAWITRLDEDAILGSHRVDPVGPLYRCYRFIAELPAGGRTFSAPSEQEDLRYYPGFHHIALLDLFGLIKVEEATTEASDGWHLRRIAPCPFGTALLKLTAGLYQSAFEADEITDADEGIWEPDELHEWLRLYFPEWKHTLAEPLTGFRDGVFVFKVSLEAKVWRRIAAPAQATLYMLASAILDAFAFDDPYHLDRFTFQGPFGLPVEINHPELSYDDWGEGPSTDEVHVGDVPLREGQSMTYIFDFGDWWEFDVRLEQIEPEQPEMEDPVLRESHGKAPEQYPDGEDGGFIIFLDR